MFSVAGLSARWTSPLAPPRWTAQGRCATVAIEALRFHAPVLVGDLFSVYSQITRTGRTSITMHIEAWVRRQRTGERMLVTEGDFTFVAISASGVTRPLPPEA